MIRYTAAEGFTEVENPEWLLAIHKRWEAEPMDGPSALKAEGFDQVSAFEAGASYWHLSYTAYHHPEHGYFLDLSYPWDGGHDIHCPTAADYAAYEHTYLPALHMMGSTSATEDALTKIANVLWAIASDHLHVAIGESDGESVRLARKRWDNLRATRKTGRTDFDPVSVDHEGRQADNAR